MTEPTDIDPLDGDPELGIVANALGFALYSEDGREVHAPGGLTPAIKVSPEEQDEALRLAKVALTSLREYQGRAEPVLEEALTLVVDEVLLPESPEFGSPTSVTYDVDLSFVPMSHDEEGAELDLPYDKESGSSVVANIGIFYAKNNTQGYQYLVPRGARGEIAQIARDVDGELIALVIWESDPAGLPRPAALDKLLGREQIYEAIASEPRFIEADGTIETAPDYLAPSHNDDAPAPPETLASIDLNLPEGDPDA